VLVAEFPDHPTWRFSNEVSDCGKYLLLYIMSGCKDMLLYFADLEKNGDITGKLNFEKIVDVFEADYDVSTKNATYGAILLKILPFFPSTSPTKAPFSHS
jgi:prolyl oligopeptidase